MLKIDPEERKREIAKRALGLFSKVGFENVSLSMIAASSGVSRTILYRYFCSKRDVLDAAILTVLREIESSCTPIIARRGPALSRLEGVCHAVVEVMFKNRDFVIAVFDFVIGMVRTGADMRANIDSFTVGTRTAIELLVKHAIRRGELPRALVVERISDAIYAEFESCAMRIVLGTEKTSGAAKKRFSDVVKALSIWK